MTMGTDLSRAGSNDEPPLWAWVAMGALAVGAIGAAIGCARYCGRPSHDRLMARPRPVVDSAHVTPPHGDVLDV